MNNRQLRNLLEVTEIKENYIVEGYATTFNPYAMYERDGVTYFEKIDRNAFLNTDMSDVIMQYDHKGRVFARQSNGTLELSVNDKGLFIRADLSKTQASRDLYEDIKEGLITKMSWAFSIGEENYDRNTRTREILGVKKIYDVSAVSIPANNDTSINARDFFNGVIEREQTERFEIEQRKRKLKLKLEMETL